MTNEELSEKRARAPPLQFLTYHSSIILLPGRRGKYPVERDLSSNPLRRML
jgi:hypothetical protein